MLFSVVFFGSKPSPRVSMTEPVLVNVYGTQDSIPPSYEAWRAGTTNRDVEPARQAGNRFLGSLKGLQIQTLVEHIPGIRKSVEGVQQEGHKEMSSIYLG